MDGGCLAQEKEQMEGKEGKTERRTQKHHRQEARAVVVIVVVVVSLQVVGQQQHPHTHRDLSQGLNCLDLNFEIFQIHHVKGQSKHFPAVLSIE